MILRRVKSVDVESVPLKCRNIWTFTWHKNFRYETFVTKLGAIQIIRVTFWPILYSSLDTDMDTPSPVERNIFPFPKSTNFDKVENSA
jgi:hypothetical protein